MQLLLEASDEHGGAKGLGLIPGCVERMYSERDNFKLPNVGWSRISIEKSDALLTTTDYFYFVHSYCAIPESSEDVLARCHYEDIDFCAAIAKDNIWGVQFHPENSDNAGLTLLKNFIAL